MQATQLNAPWTSSDRVTASAFVGLCLAAAVVGTVTAVGVRLFMQGFGLINSLTLGTFGAAPAPLGASATVLILTMGGLIVAVFMHRLTRPDTLAAMAHIIDGVAERGGTVNIRNSAVYVVGSMLGIGFGAPVGADTPSAMIGGHLGSWLASRLQWPEVFIRALVVAGVGAGISATYFAQLAAVFFALEVVLGGVGGVLFVVPTLIAVATSALVTYTFAGAPEQYAVPVGAVRWDATLLLYVVVALLAGCAAIAYVNLLPAMKALWLRANLPFWATTALAGAIVGVVGIWLPDIFGTGLSQMKSIFSGAAFPIGMLLALLVAKLILTPSSLGAGFVGGVIGPALLIGSALGAAYGDVVVRLFPGLEVSPVACAMVATAAMLAGTFHAPLFGAMMIYEMNGDYQMLLPLILGAAIGYALAQRFQPGSAYTFMFPGMGIRFVPGTFTAMHRPDVAHVDTTDAPTHQPAQLGVHTVAEPAREVTRPPDVGA